MSSEKLAEIMASSYLNGGSMAYIDSLYEDYLKDPHLVPEDWREIFTSLPKVNGNDKEVSHAAIREHFQNYVPKPKATATVDAKQARVTHLINSYRTYGHLAAKLDPLDMAKRTDVPSLSLDFHNLTNADLDTVFFAENNFKNHKMPLKDIIKALEETYCGSIGIEYKHIANSAETTWLKEKMESVQGKPNFDTDTRKNLLALLVATDGLERYLGTRYVGQKRFSLEGGDALVPMVRHIIELAGERSVNEVVIGMAHRGRLNVLVNVLGKEPKQLFEEFEGKVVQDRTGDVKYHLGYSSDLLTKKQNVVHVALAFNPSHLEIIGPVVQGSARSRLRRRNDLDHKDKVVPVVIHGDAAFAGQGVVMETFNFSQARGYSTGGTVHIVVNNQIGFTTSNPLDSRSTLYCTDVAKMVQAPILHVNGDDPEMVMYATQVAFEYRMKFKRDVVLDLVCYRRHGHNEADEPSVTQPEMYAKIKAKKALCNIYNEKLVSERIIDKSHIKDLADAYRDKLDKGVPVVDTYKGEYPGKISVDWSPYINAKWTDKVDTTVSLKTINTLCEKMHKLPDGFTLHPVAKRLLGERDKMAAGEIQMNWGFAETMAYATLLNESYSVRLSGQDSARGTFAHRHAVLHDKNTGECFVPLERVEKSPERPFYVIDSVLSEEAVLAFEYGFAASEPHSLVIWEAQFGDFANGAQVVIDQFISSGEQKWGRLCGLVMYLPHGYEGQGPEHSSARLERFMQLCAQQNIQVCNLTTPAQIFHVLRRQILRKFRKPLIIMTPKSLLRHKLATSELSELCEGGFKNIIPEIDNIAHKNTTKVILCTGKVYYDLLERRRDENLSNVAIIRIEQLYPFPKEDLRDELAKYTKANTVIWCQEEPKNQGTWFSSQHNIKDCLAPSQNLFYCGRGFAAAPAVGSAKIHAEQQKKLVEDALFGKKYSD